MAVDMNHQPHHEHQCSEEGEGVEEFPFVVNGEYKEPTPGAFPVARMIIREREETSNDFDGSAPGSLASGSGGTPSEEQTNLRKSGHGDCNAFAINARFQMECCRGPSDGHLPKLPSVEFSRSLDDFMGEILIIPGEEEQREELDSEPHHDVEERASLSSETVATGWRGHNSLNGEDASRHSKHFPPASLMQTIQLTRQPSAATMGRTVGVDSKSFSKLMSEAGSINEGRHYGDPSISMGDQSMDPPRWCHPGEILANLHSENGCVEHSGPIVDRGTRGASACSPSQPEQQAKPTIPLSSNLLRGRGVPCTASPRRATVEQLGDDSFIASVRLDTSLSAHDVGATIANAELLTSWFEPLRNIHVSATPSSTPQKEMDRRYDGEWIEASTSALALPRGNARSALHGFLCGVQEAFGFPYYSCVKMFVERHRNQVVLKLQYSESVSAIHTFTVHEVSEEDGTGENASAADPPRTSIMVKDVIYLERVEVDGDFGCFRWFDDCLWVPNLLHLAVQAAASLNALNLFISCDGNAVNGPKSGEGRIFGLAGARQLHQGDGLRKHLLPSNY